MLTAPERFSTAAEAAVDDVAACLGLAPADIRIDAHHPVIASAGLPFLIAELSGREALTRACPDIAAFGSAPTVAPIGATLRYARSGDVFAVDRKRAG